LKITVEDLAFNKALPSLHFISNWNFICMHLKSHLCNMKPTGSL